MSREDYFCAEGKPHYNYDVMYYYDSPFFTHKSKKIVVSGGGKSAYEIAVENGFQGTVEEWLNSLKGITPHIGENGNWFIGDVDTHVPASGGGGGGTCPGMINDITEEDINSYFEGEVIDDGKTDSPISEQDIDSYFNGEIIIDNDSRISEEDIDSYFDNLVINNSNNNDDILSFEEIDRLFQ